MGRPRPTIAPAGVSTRHKVKTWDKGSKIKVKK